jgi:hypothetical protein
MYIHQTVVIQLNKKMSYYFKVEIGNFKINKLQLKLYSNGLAMLFIIKFNLILIIKNWKMKKLNKILQE